VNYTLDLEGRTAVVRCWREFAFDDAIGVFRDILAAEWRSEMRDVLVLDEGSAFSPTREGIRELTGLMDEAVSKEGARIAIVVSRIVHYGIGRIIEARYPHAGMVRVFLREEAARQWLESGKYEEAVR